jgi:hypothetical protein
VDEKFSMRTPRVTKKFRFLHKKGVKLLSPKPLSPGRMSKDLLDLLGYFALTKANMKLDILPMQKKRVGTRPLAPHKIEL